MKLRALLLSFFVMLSITPPAHAKVDWRGWPVPVVGVASAGGAAALTWLIMRWWHKVQQRRAHEELMMQQRLDRVSERHQLDQARQEIHALKQALARLGQSNVAPVQPPQQPLEAQLLDRALLGGSDDK